MASGLQVALAALELANALVGSDARILEAGCLLGLVPAVLRYAFPSQPLPLRVQAAAFAHALCHGGPATAAMFVACQVSSPQPLHAQPQSQLEELAHQRLKRERFERADEARILVSYSD